MMASTRRDSAGFTLIELLVVIVVLGVLAGVVVFSLGGVASQATVSACRADVKTLETAVAAYNAQTGGTPTVSAALLTQGVHPYVQSWPSNSGYTITVSGGQVYVQTPTNSVAVLASDPNACDGAGGSFSTSTTTSTVPLASLGADQSASGTNIASAQGGAVSSTSGPLGAGSASLPGTAGSYLSTATQELSPSTFSIAAWFKTSSPGPIVGFTNSATNSSPSDWDRMIWVDPTGHLVFGVWPYQVAEVTSPSTYNDGQWHQVVGTWGPGGQVLYVDGVKVASSASSPVYTYNGYWHLGYSYMAGWPDVASTNYFTGNVADIAIFPSQLSASRVQSLASAATNTAEYEAVTALNPSSFWPLNV